MLVPEGMRYATHHEWRKTPEEPQIDILSNYRLAEPAEVLAKAGGGTGI